MAPWTSAVRYYYATVHNVRTVTPQPPLELRNWDYKNWDYTLLNPSSCTSPSSQVSQLPSLELEKENQTRLHLVTDHIRATVLYAQQ